MRRGCFAMNSASPGTPAPFRVAVLTSSALGHESAAALSGLAGVEVVAIVIAPAYRPRPLPERLRRLVRREGVTGLPRWLGRRLRAAFRAPRRRLAAPVRVVALTDFHAPSGLAALRALDLDLLVVDGTGILREPVFTAARHGAVNVHCGRLPQYRGAPPAFWELYNGEPEVGVTVHRVTAQVDAGAILAQCVLPLDPAPARDPVAYAEAVWRSQLRPAALGLLREVVLGLRDGSIHETPQPPFTGEAHRRPDARPATVARLYSWFIPSEDRRAKEWLCALTVRDPGRTVLCESRLPRVER